MFGDGWTEEKMEKAMEKVVKKALKEGVGAEFANYQVPSVGQGGAGRLYCPRLLHREAPLGRRSGLPLVAGRHASPHRVGDLGHQ